MQGPTDTFKKRFYYSVMILGLSVIGTPFIPFSPIAIVFGCWNDNDKPKSAFAISNVLPSYIITVLIGVAAYGYLFSLLFN